MFCKLDRSRPYRAVLIPGIVLGCAYLSSCSRKAPASEERIAILRFENLSSDASADWIGRGLSELLTEQLSGRPDRYSISSFALHAAGGTGGARPIQAPGISAEDSLAVLAGATEIGYGDYTVRNGRVETRLFLQDVATRRYAKVATASGSVSDIPAIANSLAGQIAPDAMPAHLRSSDALLHYVKGLEDNAPDQIISNARAAIAADPGFIPPYLLAAEWTAHQGNPSEATSLLDAALKQHPSALELAELHLQIAGLNHDVEARAKALAEVANADPGNPDQWRTLAETQFARHRYADAAAAFQKLTSLEPGNRQAFNLLGYSLAYSGKIPEALAALQRYQALAPNEVDPIDSSGDVNLLSGHPHEAETFYLNSSRKNPKYLEGLDLLKAAVARLMTGDIAGATQIHEKYVEGLSQSPDRNPEIERIEWMWTTGQRKEAWQRLLAFARAAENSPHRENAERAYGELSIWTLLLGDRPAAAQFAQKAFEMPGVPVSAAAVVAQFLAQPPAPAAEMAARSKALFRNPGLETVDQLALACRYILDRQFSDAAPILQKLYDEGARTPADEGIPTMLAWALLETGRDKEAAPLLAANPIPPATGFTIFTPFYFPRVFALRKLAAEKAGKTQEAQENDKLYRTLSGSQPLVWDK